MAKKITKARAIFLKAYYHFKDKIGQCEIYISEHKLAHEIDDFLKYNTHRQVSIGRNALFSAIFALDAGLPPNQVNENCVGIGLIRSMWYAGLDSHRRFSIGLVASKI